METGLYKLLHYNDDIWTHNSKERSILSSKTESDAENCITNCKFNARCTQLWRWFIFCLCIRVFQLVPPNKVKPQIPVMPDSLAAAVGVSVVLRKEDMVSALTFLSLFFSFSSFSRIYHSDIIPLCVCLSPLQPPKGVRGFLMSNNNSVASDIYKSCCLIFTIHETQICLIQSSHQTQWDWDVIQLINFQNSSFWVWFSLAPFALVSCALVSVTKSHRCFGGWESGWPRLGSVCIVTKTKIFPDPKITIIMCTHSCLQVDQIWGIFSIDGMMKIRFSYKIAWYTTTGFWKIMSLDKSGDQSEGHRE